MCYLWPMYLTPVIILFSAKYPIGMFGLLLQETVM